MANSVSLNLSQRFQSVFQEASRTTGAKFDFLLHTAQRESGLNESAKAPTSSATGLFQFVEQTWLETMKEAGPELGYGKQASAITQIGDKYYVPDAQVRQEILDLRKDAKASALLAGAYAQKNEGLLEQRLERTPTSGELYAAHFLGAQGSGRLIELAEQRPDVEAYKIFPQQAEANRNIFFERNGEARTVAEVYDNLVSTVPDAEPKKKSITNLFGFTNWFKPKATLEATQSARNEATQAYQAASAISLTADDKATPETQVEQVEAQVLPSRYGLGYSADNSVASQTRASRLVLGGDGDLVVQAADIRARSSRIYSDASNAVSADVASSASMGLPRAKPTAGDSYVDALNGVLPRAKPTASDAATQGAGQILQQGNSQESFRRFGALDLTSFLNNDVFKSTDKA